MRFVDISTAVEARFDEEGGVTPITFTWQGRDMHISDVGRRWTEPHGPHQLRHYLVMTPAQDTFELCLDTGTLQWKITRAWERERVA
jgi:hypothetical protein